jgi:pimeloyl-ACP methyl ester carboxylesterase
MSALLLAACGGKPSVPTSTPGEALGTSIAAPSARSTATPGATLGASTTPASQTGSALPRIKLPVRPGETVEGLLDVDGHDIYARCSGTGSPTVVYFTGWAPDPSKRGVSAIRAVEGVSGGKHRICSYERRNTGRSESVDGTQAPEDIVADIDGVLRAMGENGPFVLLGASFGGLVAGAYAVAHPDRTAGILLLDSSIPDDFIIDKRHGFQGMCLKANRQADASDSLEKIDNCRLAKWAYDRRAEEPAVPLLYLAAKNPSHRGDAADDTLRKAFVKRWSPGVWESVSAPHWMDEADPKLVVTSLNRVITLANAKGSK